MPTYRYRCIDGHEFDEWASISADSSNAQCPECSMMAVKVMVPPRLSREATPSKKDRVSAPPAGNKNSWENGIPVDDRGMPWLNSAGEPIGVKEMANRRSEIEGWEHRLRNDPNVYAGQEK